MLKRLMIDIETLDTEPGGVILQIGAVVFNHEWVPSHVQGMDEAFKFQALLDWRAQDRDGCTISDSTWDWWHEQDATLRNRLLEPVVSWRADKALTHLAEFIAAAQPAEVWSHTWMDLTMLEAHFTKYKVRCPWNHSMRRDSKTLFTVLGDRRAELGVGQAHDALMDAWAQAVGVQRCLELAAGCGELARC